MFLPTVHPPELVCTIKGRESRMPLSKDAEMMFFGIRMNPTKEKATGVFRIVGMDCAKCSVTITKNLEKLDGVKKVGINYLTEYARVEYDPSKVSPETIKKTIEKLGYKAFETKGGMML